MTLMLRGVVKHLQKKSEKTLTKFIKLAGYFQNKVIKQNYLTKTLSLKWNSGKNERGKENEKERW